MAKRWQFKTRQFTVTLKTSREYGYRYDGDDPDGETQAKLDSGEYVAFSSFVTVEFDGKTIGEDSLHGSVYTADTMAEFWTAHRDPDTTNRNSFVRARDGSLVRGDVVICHYFPEMVRTACNEARTFLLRYRDVHLRHERVAVSHG